MTSDGKKLQMFLCLLAGGGLFLPLMKVTYLEETTSVSFMKVFEGGRTVGAGTVSKIDK